MIKKRTKKEQQRIDEIAELDPCSACNGNGVYHAGFKFWATCKECGGDRYVKPRQK